MRTIQLTILTKARKHIQSLGYSKESTWTIRNGQAFAYISKRKRYYAVTVSTCTGIILIEILKRHILIRLEESTAN